MVGRRIALDKQDNSFMMESVKAQLSLKRKNIIITGGSGFLGWHFATAVAEMGGFPILLDKDESSLRKSTERLQRLGHVVKSYRLNITNSNKIEILMDRIQRDHNTIDGLINAAAYAMKDMRESSDDYFESFEKYDQNLWQVAIDVNLTGTFLITQAVGRIMKTQGKGVIVNIASDVAVISPDHRIYEPDHRLDYKGVPFNTPISYSVSKAGILAFTRYLATYWAKDGIRVNSLSPAGVYRNQDPKFVEQLAFRIPLGRMAQPEELKGPIVFLCSDASSFMTGANLIIDGGRTIW